MLTKYAASTEMQTQAMSPIDKTTQNWNFSTPKYHFV